MLVATGYRVRSPHLPPTQSIDAIVGLPFAGRSTHGNWQRRKGHGPEAFGDAVFGALRLENWKHADRSMPRGKRPNTDRRDRSREECGLNARGV